MNSHIESTADVELEILLDFYKVSELKQIINLLGFKCKSGLKKAQLIETLAAIYFNHPEEIIKTAYCYELQAFKDVIEGKMTVEYAEKSGMATFLNRFGLIYIMRKEITNELSLHFETDMAQLLLPMIQPEIDRRMSDGSFLIEKVALGCANIYGYTDLFYFLSYIPEVEHKIGHVFDDATAEKAFYPFEYQFRKGKYIDMPLLSPFAALNGFYPDDEHIKDSGLEAKSFDLNNILRFGEMPYPNIAIKQAANLRKMLEKYGNPKAGDADDIIRKLWIDKQNESINPMSYMSNIADLFIYHNMDQVNECITAAMEFINNVPYWRFSGNSSAEVSKKEMEAIRKSGKIPEIKIGPNLRARGIESFEQLQELAARGEDFPIPDTIMNPFGGKVGRNDPCPCGSGKKYKHCCGK